MAFGNARGASNACDTAYDGVAAGNARRLRPAAAARSADEAGRLKLVTVRAAEEEARASADDAKSKASDEGFVGPPFAMNLKRSASPGVQL